MSANRIVKLSSLVLWSASLVVAGTASAAPASDAQSLEELRNTVVNLLGALVERNVLTREQAESMVSTAQKKAADAAAASKARDAADEAAGAVRVPYVPQIVKDEIRKQVAADLEAEVTTRVVEQAQNEGWGLPAALPDWISRIRISGDVRLRGQGDIFAQDNPRADYIDFLNVNDKGGIGKAGAGAFVNTTEDRERLRARLRFGIDATLPGGWSTGFRIATGNLRDAVSTNQTLGNTGARYQTGVDLAYIRWSGETATRLHGLTFSGGRITNPWLSTDLVWDQDLSFEGVAATLRQSFSRQEPDRRSMFLTLGAFPLQEIELSRDKWFYGGQLGLDWRTGGGHRFRFGAAYYAFQNITGKRNTLDSTLLDYTAPQFLQRGNTLFDIRNDTDPNTNLFALAADYRLLNATALLDWRLSDSYRLGFSADYVKNIGYNQADVFARTGLVLVPRTKGYAAELNFGSTVMARPHAWRAFVGYRYLERDAVLDAFTDSDFRLGGTDVQGFIVGGEYAISYRTLLRARYLSGNEIDGAPFGVDVFQLDLTTQF
jgi:hypothetical protein